MTRNLRLRRRAAPLAVLAVVAFGAGLLTGGLRDSEAESTARDFGEAWEERDYGAMWRLLTPAAQERTSPQELAAAYDEALGTATATQIDVDDPREEGDGARVDVVVGTRIFGEVEDTMLLPVEDGRIAWQPHLVFPGLSQGEELSRETEAPERAKILAGDGSTLVEGPASARSSPLGTAGAEIIGVVAAPTLE
ncbi:MAG: NTF2-like N-terminal transpeptidase domain-containing protein, partial [Thermoleophilaceae bacterium]